MQFHSLIRICLVTAILFSLQIPAHAQVPMISSGTIRHIEKFPSKYVAQRNIDIWLPEDYDPKRSYAVLYMQDGRSLFDSSIMWNRQEWGMDETMGLLLKEKKIRDCIVVGIWNSESTRHNDYLPQQPFETLSKDLRDTLFTAKRLSGQPVYTQYQIWSDYYLRFLVKELKPYIDSAFSTLKGPLNTFIAGSSMGGLVSLYAICEYPEVFGGAACLSTHWTGIFRVENNPFPAAMMNYLSTHLPSPRDHRIYFDYGTETIDSLYQGFQPLADKLMKKRGYSSANWITKKFTGADHSENAWRRRLDMPLTFLLGKR
ncbi:MAG: alpha/beta hydrolase [Chitinophagaceae bacterium]|nr:alpha/beta hydrolase [Chitinophagaceae bacterium]